MSKKIKIMAAAFFVLAIAVRFGWKWSQEVTVDITSIYPDADIEFAPATDAASASPRWFPVESGSNRLAKGDYFFKIASADIRRDGLISIEKETAIVLK